MTHIPVNEIEKLLVENGKASTVRATKRIMLLTNVSTNPTKRTNIPACAGR